MRIDKAGRLSAWVMSATLVIMAVVSGAQPARAAGQNSTDRFAFLPENEITQVRQQLKDHRENPQTRAAYETLIASAEKALKKDDVSVTQKGMTPPSGSKHDYLSLSAYWWPDPDKADGLPWIRRDGQVNPASKNDQSDGVRLADFTSRVQQLTLAGYFSGDRRFSDKAIQMIRVWFINPETRMNPNLDFAQGVPGVAPGRNAGVLDGRYFATRIIDSLHMLQQTPGWTEQDQQQITQWMTEYLHWLQTSKLAKKEAATLNNHGNWYVVQVAGIASYLQKPEVIKEMAVLMEKKLDHQIQADGSQPEELARTRSFHYSYFNLQAMTQMAQLAQKYGIDLWHYQTPQGSSIITALDFMAPYTDDKKVWPYENLERISVRLIPLLSAADNALHASRYEKQIQQANFAPAEGSKNAGYQADVIRGAVSQAQRETWLLALPFESRRQLT